jgi:hypothetical protein
MKIIMGWWGTPYDSVSSVNERALVVIEKSGGQFALEGSPLATPHQALVYEVRVKEGYGMRWFRIVVYWRAGKLLLKSLHGRFEDFWSRCWKMVTK